MDKIYKLSELKDGVKASIVKITAPKELKSRLLSLGFIKGNHICISEQTLTKATMKVKIGNNNSFALRHEESEYILVEEL